MTNRCWPESSGLGNVVDFCLKLPNSVRNAKKILEAMPLAMLSNQKYTTLPRQDDSGQYHDASF